MIKKAIIIILIIIGVILLIDKRLDEVERERCRVWNWEVCQKIERE